MQESVSSVQLEPVTEIPYSILAKPLLAYFRILLSSLECQMRIKTSSFKKKSKLVYRDKIRPGPNATKTLHGFAAMVPS